jgi:TetR/AcrR family transcriptional repressor of nem operon
VKTSAPQKGRKIKSVGSSQADKVASHQRIVKAASRGIRRDGIDNVSVAELMSAAGLTHGGFYRHFDSRDDLMAEAIGEALAQGSQRFNTSAALGGPEALSAIIDGYLSRFHRDKPETGCAVAALPGDIARADTRCREAYAQQVRSYIAVLTELMPAGDSDDAQLVLAALIGGLVLARAVGDRALSDEILDRVARALRRYAHPVEEI